MKRAMRLSSCTRAKSHRSTLVYVSGRERERERDRETTRAAAMKAREERRDAQTLQEPEREAGDSSSGREGARQTVERLTMPESALLLYLVPRSFVFDLALALAHAWIDWNGLDCAIGGYIYITPPAYSFSSSYS